MTDDQITRLFELKRRLDAGEISKEMFNLGVAAIRGADMKNDSTHSSSNKSSKKRNIIIATIITVVALLCGGLFLLLHNHDKSEELPTCPININVNFPDEDRIRNVISNYCTAICENDFETLASIYAPTVLRFQDAYNKDRDYVIECHQQYDNTFKVYGKHSSIRWDSFRMNMASNGTVDAIIVEDYSIDRQDKSRYSVFVLEKHFIIDSAYHIVSVYDNQLSRKKGTELSIEQLAAEASNYLLKEYARGVYPIEVGEVYDRVDFRKNEHFREFIRRVVKSDYDFQTMMNSNVRTTEFRVGAMGKLRIFTIQGTDYTIDYREFHEGAFFVTVTVNGDQYEYVSSDYMNYPLYPVSSPIYPEEE